METRGNLCALAASLLWSCSSVLFARLLARYGALSCNLFKVFVAAGLFWITSLCVPQVEAAYRAPGPDILMLALSGVAGLALGDLAYFAAINRLGVRRATLIQGTFPVFLLVFSLVDPAERLSPAEACGILLVVAGVAAVTRAREPLPKSAAGGSAAGIVLGLLAALGQAVGILLARGALQHVDFVTGSTWRLSGAIAALVIALSVSPWGRGALRRALLEPVLWKRGVPVVFLGSYVAIGCMTLAITWGKTAVAGTLLSLSPILVIPFAVGILRERVSPWTLPGTLIAVVGVILVSVPEFATRVLALAGLG